MTASSAAQLLEISPSRSMISMALIDHVGGGLPLRAVDRLAEQIAPGDRTFKSRLVSRASYARRRAGGATPDLATLSGAESERVARLSRLWAFAVEVWGGSEGARRFLREPHMLLNGRTALDVALSGELGGRLVEEILGRLAYGSAT